MERKNEVILTQKFESKQTVTLRKADMSHRQQQVTHMDNMTRSRTNRQTDTSCGDTCADVTYIYIYIYIYIYVPGRLSVIWKHEFVTRDTPNHKINETLTSEFNL